MRFQPCAACQLYRPFEMSNVIEGLCGFCAQKELWKVADNPKPFGDGALTLAQLAGMGQYRISELRKFEKRWGEWE